MKIHSLCISLFLLLVVLPLGAVEYSGTLEFTFHTLEDDDVILNHRVDVIVFWKAYNMMGEPVIYSELYWIIDEAEIRREGGGYARMNTKDIMTSGWVPREVLQKINISNNTTVSAYLKEKDGDFASLPIKDFHSRVYLQFDPGVPGEPFIGSIREFNNLRKEAREKYSGFNVPGSPSWSRLFHKGFISTKYDDYVSAEKAKEIFRQGFSLNNIDALLRTAFDLSAVKAWLLEQEIEEAEQAGKDDEIAALKEELAETEAKKRQYEREKREKKDQLSKEEETEEGPRWDILDDETAGEKQDSASAQNEDDEFSPQASLLLLIDTSGSMDGNKIRAARKAAEETVKTALSRNTEVAVFGFSGECNSPISKRLPFTTNSRKAVNFVRSLDAGGGTPLAPALEEVNRYMQRYRSGGSETQMIILLADGDNSCGSVRSVMNKLKQNGIVFRHETIGLGVDSGSDAVRDLKLIAEETGGGYNYARDHREVEEAFTNAVDSMELLDLLGTFGDEGENTGTSDEQKEEKGIMSDW